MTTQYRSLREKALATLATYEENQLQARQEQFQIARERFERLMASVLDWPVKPHEYTVRPARDFPVLGTPVFEHEGLLWFTSGGGLMVGHEDWAHFQPVVDAVGFARLMERWEEEQEGKPFAHPLRRKVR